MTDQTAKKERVNDYGASDKSLKARTYHDGNKPYYNDQAERADKGADRGGKQKGGRGNYEKRGQKQFKDERHEEGKQVATNIPIEDRIVYSQKVQG